MPFLFLILEILYGRVFSYLGCPRHAFLTFLFFVRFIALMEGSLTLTMYELTFGLNYYDATGCLSSLV